MKVDFSLPKDNRYHQYCPRCHSEEVSRIFEGDKTFYTCKSCQGKFPRLIIIDPEVVWWIDKITQEYWHESVGVFIFNTRGEALFFERIIYPFAFAIPAGHLEVATSLDDAAQKEVLEEVGVQLSDSDLFLFSDEDIVGDQCRRGADNHRWHLYTVSVEPDPKITMGDEGKNPHWLSLEEARKKELVYPVRYFIEKYGDKLFSG